MKENTNYNQLKNPIKSVFIEKSDGGIIAITSENLEAVKDFL